MKRRLFLILSVIVFTFITINAKDPYMHFKGKIGTYDITMKIKEDGGHRFNGTGKYLTDFVGSYTYVKARNTLKLFGEESVMSADEYVFEEVTPRANHSANWVLRGDFDSKLIEEMTVKKTGKTFKIVLYREISS